MMLSRRIPSASPGARASPARNPSSSGPRCSIAAVIARTRDSASALREAKATPHMPHTLLFDLRGREEGSASANSIPAKMKARDHEPPVGEPRENEAEQHEKDTGEHRNNKNKERPALQEQAPVERFVPSRVDPVERAAQAQPLQRETGQANMGKIVVIVDRWIVWNGAGSLREERRILQILAGQ